MCLSLLLKMFLVFIINPTSHNVFGQSTEDPICQEPLDLTDKIRSILTTPRNRQMLLLLGINSDQNSTIDLRHEPEPNRTNPADVVPSGHGCPEQTEKSGHVSGRSLCPWFVDMNRQRDRIPYLIPQARCKCHRCLNVAVESSLERYTRCEYHYHHMQVLRRLTCKNGFYVYKIHSEAIPVACICVHRKIAMTG